MTIKLRILLLVMFVAIAATSSIGTLAFSRSRQALERFIGSALANAASETLDKIDRKLREHLEDARHWARDDLVIRAALGEIDPDLKVLSTLDEVRRTYGGIPDLLVVSTDGKVQAAADARLMGKPLPAELAKLRAELPENSFFAGPRWLAHANARCLLMVLPIELAEAEVAIGELLVLLDFADIYAIIDAVKVTEAQPWFLLLERSGHAIGLPVALRTQWADRRPTPREIGLSTDLDSLKNLGGSSLLSNPASDDTDLVGGGCSKGYRDFTGLGWTLLYRVAGREAFAPVTELRSEVVRVGLTLTALVTLIGLLMALQVVRPLATITDAMQQVREGNFEVKLQAVTSGEVGRLVESFNFMLQGLKDREFMRDVFSKHVSPAVARKILSERDALQLGGERRRACILFTDIRSFTTLSEQLPAPEVVALLNEYFTGMVSVVFRHEGMINKFIGDALMAVWGVPFDVPHATARAAFAALEMQQCIRAISERRTAAGLPAVKMGIGFTTGDVVAGNIGSPERMEYTVIGDEVNIASRVEGLTKQFGAEVIMSESSYLELREICEAQALGEVKVKGREQPITVYRLDSMKIRPEDLEGPASN
jgi:adenylate cyclase